MLLLVKNLPANARSTRDMGLIPGLGQSPGVENGNPLQYSCLENSMDRGARQVTPWDCKKLDTTERLSTHTHKQYILTQASGSLKLRPHEVLVQVLPTQTVGQ